MSVLSVVAVSQLDESFRGLGRGHGVVDISAAAVSAVPQLLDCAPRGQSCASRGQMLLIAHVAVDGVALAVVVVALGERWMLRELLLEEYMLARQLMSASSPRMAWSCRHGMDEPAPLDVLVAGGVAEEWPATAPHVVPAGAAFGGVRSEPASTGASREGWLPRSGD